MQFDRLKQLPDLFRTRAETDGAHDRVAGLVWRQAADLVAQALQELVAEQLSIPAAARAYGWDYEALRRKVSGDPVLNSGAPGNPKVTHETMLRLGRGRGPRARQGTKDSAEVGLDSEPNAPAAQGSSPGISTRTTPESAAAAVRLSLIKQDVRRSRRN